MISMWWIIWVFNISQFLKFQRTAALIVSYEGGTATLPCTESPTIYPIWSGPHVIYYNFDQIPKFNPALGEKASRLAWDPSNNKSLIINNVMKKDTGTYKCYYNINDEYKVTRHALSIRILPLPPVISNAESLDGTRTVVRGTEGQELTLQCTSTGGYPEPLLYWYKDNTQTQPLDTTKTSQEDSDGTFTIVMTHTFTPSNQDDDVTFVCQSSFSPSPPSVQRAQVQLLLNREPSQPVIKSYPVVEGDAGIIAKCYTSEFRPDDIKMSFQMNGNNVTSNPSVTGDTGQTFSAVASYTATLQRQQNGKPLVCYVAHQTLQTPLTGRGTADVRFGPLSASLTGSVDNIVAESNIKITLTCTSGTSNPKSTITWYRGGVQIPDQAPVTESRGDYNGVLTSQILEFVPDRTMDGASVYCTVHNIVNGQSPVPSSTKTLDLRYHPIITMASVTEVEEGSTTVLRCKIDSKPKSSVTWYHDEISLRDDATSISNSVFQYDIPVTNRTDSGIYKCAANNGHGPTAESETTLLVLYAPDVTVTTTNITINDSLAVLKCTPSGKPATYVYSEWQHIWPGFGRVDHPTRLGNDPVLALSALTYEYSGIYICTVSNGVSGSLNPDAGYGTVYLQVDTFPVITTPTPMKVYSNIGDTGVAYVHFYSNRPDNKVDCFRGLIQVDCYSEILNGDIELPVFGTIVPTMGSVASVSIDIYNMSQYGMYNIRISNGIGTSSIDTEIVPEDKRPQNQNNTGAIVGGSVGASFLVLGGMIFFVIWVKYLRQRTSKPSGTSSSNLAVERAGNSTENDASGIHLDLDGHKDVYYNIERNVYEELQERSGDTHEYEAIDRQRQIETSGPKNKEYDNRHLRCQATS